MVVCGTHGAIVSKIRTLLVPPPSRELRVKSEYYQPDTVKAAIGCKIVAADLEHAVPGSDLFLIEEGQEDIEEIKANVQKELEGFLQITETGDEGVSVQASTLGALEALLEFLRESKIPVARGGINIGPIYKKDVMRTSIMLERNRAYAVILAFDVTVEQDARELAQQQGIRIFEANIIYHLFDQFTQYMKDLESTLKDRNRLEVIFPCQIRILPDHVYNIKSPIVVGCNVLAGTLRVGTPLIIPSKNLEIGRVTGLRRNDKEIEIAKTGEDVSVQIQPVRPTLQYGRHFDHKDDLYSHVSRRSINVLKESFRDEVTEDDVRLLARLVHLLNIPKG